MLCQQPQRLLPVRRLVEHKVPAVDTSSSALSCRAAEKPPLVVGIRCEYPGAKSGQDIAVATASIDAGLCFFEHAEGKSKTIK